MTELQSGETSPDTANSAWDTISTFFGALGLGTSEQTEDALTLNFNSDQFWGKKNPITLRATLHRASLFEKLVEAQPEPARPAFRESQEKLLEDFDDIEVTLAWSRSPRHSALNSLSVIVSDAYSDAFAQSQAAGEAIQNPAEAYFAFKEALATKLGEVDRGLVAPTSACTRDEARELLAQIEPDGEDRSEDEEPPRSVLRSAAACVGLEAADATNPNTYAGLDAAIRVAAEQSASRVEAYARNFTPDDADLFSKLAANEQQLRVAVSLRERDDLAGTDDAKLSISWERSPVSLSSAYEECPQGGAGAGLCLIEFSRENAAAIRRGSRLSVSAAYGESSRYAFSVPDFESFELEPTESLVAAATYGQNLRLDEKSGKVTLRFDLEAKYEDVTGDPQKNSRFVSTATFAQRITDESHASFSVVYANRPEYRGDVDQELSARVGLKWTTGD